MQLSSLANVTKTKEKNRSKKLTRLKKLKDVAIKNAPLSIEELGDFEVEDCMMKKLKVNKKVSQVEKSVITLEENGRQKSFLVINDYDLKIPKNIQLMLNMQKIDDDNETTESLIERAICRAMDNLCYSLKKMKRTIHDFNFYKKRNKSDDSGSFTFSNQQRKDSWSCIKGSNRKNYAQKGRTRSVKPRRTCKRVKPKKRKCKSIGRPQKVQKVSK